MKHDMYYINVLNVVSSLAVVFLHANGIFWSRPSYGFTWISANIIESFFYFAVPVFFMISGCTLIDFRERCSIPAFFIKRLKKAVIPFLFWSFVAMLFSYFTAKTEMDWSCAGIIKGILFTKYMPIYWFFMPLFAIYLAMPVLTNIQNKICVFTYMAGYAMISISLISFIKPFGVDYFPSSLITPVSGGLLVYPLLGYIFHKIEVRKRYRVVLYILGLGCAICHCVFTTILSPNGGEICRYFKGYSLLPNVLYAVSVFVFFKYNAELLMGGGVARKIIAFLRPATFGIYLIHVYLLTAVQSSGISIASIEYRTCGAVVIFFICAIIIRIAQKCKWGRIIFP